MALPPSLTTTESGHSTAVIGAPSSRKSYVPLLSRSFGSVYPPKLLTLPLEDIDCTPNEFNESTNIVITESGPISPSPFASKNPASKTSKHPSPSASRSNLLGIPSWSLSWFPVPS